jgi:hypothetical protein
VRRLLEVGLVLAAHIARAVGSESMLQIPNRHGTAPAKAQPSPNSVPIPARLSFWSNHCVACRNCCMRAVRTSASETGAFPCQPVQSSEISPLPSARKPVLHPIRRSRGLVRRHVRRAVCASTASTPRYPKPPAILKTKNKTGVPPGPIGGYGMGTGYAGRGYPLGHTDPSPAFALHRYGCTALHWAAEHGHLPSVCAFINAGAPLDIQDCIGWAFLRRFGAAESVRSGWASAAATAARRATPLHCAAEYGHADVMAALLGAGADASIKNSNG